MSKYPLFNHKISSVFHIAKEPHLLNWALSHHDQVGFYQQIYPFLDDMFYHLVDPNQITDGKTPLVYAIENGLDIEVVEMFLKNGGDPNIGPILPLHEAVYLNDKEMVQLLLKYGANPNKLDHNGNKALAYAQSREIVCDLVMARGDGDIPLLSLMHLDK